MEEILANQGLCLIVKHISSFLDPKSLAQCRVVCHSWRNLIDNDRQWLLFQLEHIHKKEKIFIDVLANDKPKVKASIEERFPEWYAFFKAATRRQNIPEMKEFLKHMWIYYKNDSISFYTNPLHEAAAGSNIIFAQFIIKSGIDLKMKNTIGWTAMHFACRYGQIEMVQLLMPAFDATSRTSQGLTIFHLAARNSDPQVAKLILDTFKFEDIRDDFGWTMLHRAVAYGPKETIEFLIGSRHKLGINIEEQANDGSTILHLAFHYRHKEIVDLVCKGLEEINSEINFDTRNQSQTTPLHFACMNKTSDVAIRLLKIFPDKINVLSNSNLHVLHLACQFGNLELLKYIFENPDLDIDFNVVDLRGNTPFHIACYYGQVEVVKFMLDNSIEKGVDIDIFKKNNSQKTAEDIARRRGHKDISEVLKILTHIMKNEVYIARLETLCIASCVVFSLFSMYSIWKNF